MPINYFNIENSVAGFSQKNYQTAPHAHFSVEVVFSLSGWLNITTENHEYLNIRAAVIGSNILHTFSCIGGECQIYFVNPTATIGQQILRNYYFESKDVVVLGRNDAEKFKEECNLIANKDHHTSLSEKNIDERIGECLDWIETNYTKESVNISALSEELFLSESRLAHLFKEQMGISIHQYILWKKIERAVKKFLKGYSLTECAHFCGFTDSSHFNKTFKKMFGVNPSFALK